MKTKNCLYPVQDEQSDLGSISGLNAPGDQSQSDADQYAPDINTTHGNRTRLHENEEQDTNNQCGYEQQGNDRASQFNECNTDYGAYINPDVLEDVTETTGGSYPEMRSSQPPDTEYHCVPPRPRSTVRISHFRVRSSLYFKASLSAKSLK